MVKISSKTMAVGAGLAGALLLGATVRVEPAHAVADPLKPAKTCRKTLGKEFAKVAKAGLKWVDKCHKEKNKIEPSPAPGGPCNDLQSADPLFDPEGQYDLQVVKSTDKISGVEGKCLPGEPGIDHVLGLYDGDDPVAKVLPLIEEAIEKNSQRVAGDGAQPVKDAGKCVDEVAKHRSKIVNQIVKEAQKCQEKTLDVLAVDQSEFGELAQACEDTALAAANDPLKGSIPKALAKIPGKCLPPDGTPPVGICGDLAVSPLPGCAIDSAVANGLRIARALYSVVSEPAPDQSQSTCGVPTGTRKVTISLDIPGPDTLAGVQVNLDYPQFEASLPSRGGSAAVAGKVKLLQTPADLSPDIFLANDLDNELAALVLEAQDAFITDGPILEVTLDSCVPRAYNVCLRQQNVFGCCPAGLNIPDPARVPPSALVCGTAVRACTGFSPLTPPTGLYEENALGGCCPNDDACNTQDVATSCAVSDPVDADGNPVAGVTCTVSVTGAN